MREEDFKEELRRAGAREFQVVSLSDDPERALAAIAQAREKGVEHVVGYAISLYEDPAWRPSGERPRKATNQAVEVECAECGGDRFVVHRYRAPQQSAWMRERGIEIPASADPIEEMKPCPSCNPTVDASFFRVDGSKFRVAR